MEEDRSYNEPLAHRLKIIVDGQEKRLAKVEGDMEEMTTSLTSSLKAIMEKLNEDLTEIGDNVKVIKDRGKDG